MSSVFLTVLQDQEVYLFFICRERGVFAMLVITSWLYLFSFVNMSIISLCWGGTAGVSALVFLPVKRYSRVTPRALAIL
jgi:hypothetical protein